MNQSVMVKRREKRASKSHLFNSCLWFPEWLRVTNCELKAVIFPIILSALSYDLNLSWKKIHVK